MCQLLLQMKLPQLSPLFPTNNSQMVVYQPSLAIPSVKIMPYAEVEKAKFKRRKHPPTKFKDFTNPSRKKFKVNDPCEIDPLRLIEPEQLNFFLKWLDRNVENKNYIDLKSCDARVDWFQWLKTLGKWLNFDVRNFSFVTSLIFQ